MQPYFVDLHTHTIASDGTDTPRELVIKAAKLKLAAIAITDHDTIAGLEEGEQAGKENQVEVIRGCELGVTSKYGEIHLLGLWLPQDNISLREMFKTLLKDRHDRARLIINKLNKLGYNISYEEIIANTPGEAIGRLHIAQHLTKKGYFVDTKEAFKSCLGHNGLAYIPKTTISLKEGIRVLADAGAMVSFAHPMLLRCPKDWLEDTIVMLKDYGLSAIEAYHSDHSQKDERYCVDLASRYQLGITGGSDYHGAGKPNVKLGRGRGGVRMTLAMLDILKERHFRIKSNYITSEKIAINNNITYFL